MKLSSIEKRKIRISLIIITISIILYHIFNNFNSFKESVESLYRSSFSQITTAFFIAYLLNLPMRFIENILVKNTKLKNETRRGISIALTIILGLLVMIVLLRFAIPQLTESVNRLSQNIDGYILTVKEWLNDISQNYHYQLPKVLIDKITEIINELIKFVSLGIGMIVESLYGWISGTLSSLFGFVVSFAVSIYMLVEKERIMLALKKILYSVISVEKGDKVVWLLKILNNSFSNFFRGQIIEGLILSVLAIISMTIFGFEFSILIGSIVGLTNIIPMFGAFLGGMVGFLILLMVNPIQALWFALFVVVLQQIESNIIYPRVVGSAIGLSGFWIFVAVIVGGGIAGLSGIIIGIPLFTTLQVVLKEFTKRRLREKQSELPLDLREKIE